ncbi:putative [ribosomal protein S5]-alanine N-acetyltransferase [Macadamia integrifolia]|uniref:putative [ribosomal protein S5]-alanine N-acetyltransferase n=1 Tax=Macadamia integrifolia TaxID=60698 RepID=UPI001C4FF908|nr:putative [ribosomal protein S5]-alanine N-acetyltransferase [Macadamia integrifolia]
MAPLLNTKVNLSDISLRPFEESDLDDYMTFKGDHNVSQFCGWNTMCKEEAFDDLLYAIYTHPWYRAICVKDRPIGCIFVKQGKGSDRCRGEIGYVLGSGYWGQGITTHAVKMVISSIFSELEGLERLEALIDVENLRSQRVIEKAGFIREGVLRKYWILRGRTLDMVIYSLLKTDTTVHGLYSLETMLEMSSIS